MTEKGPSHILAESQEPINSTIYAYAGSFREVNGRTKQDRIGKEKGGGSEVLTNLLGGHIPVANTSPATVNQYVEAGKLRVLAISGDKRLPQWKNVPTLKELGYNIVVTQYRGFGAKKGLPPDVKATLAGAIKKAVAEPGFKAYMAKNFMDDAFMGPDEFAATVRADYEYMGKLMQKVVKK